MIKYFQLNKFELRKYDLIIILGIYLISRIIIYNFLGFNNTPDFFHFSDKYLLQNDLLKTTLYLHSQPPLLNFFLGIFLKIFNGDLSKLSTLFYFLNTSLTVLILIIVRKIFKIYNLNQYLSLAVILFLTLNPNFVYYENYSHPIYSHIVCFLFFFLTYCLLKFCTKRKQKYENLTYITLTIFWDIGGGYNEYNKIENLVKIVRKGFPGKNREILLTYSLNSVKSVGIKISEGLNPKRIIYLCLKDNRKIPLTPVQEPISISNLEEEAANLAKFLELNLENL